MAKRKSRADIRKKRSKYSRRQDNRELRQVFLIVCEGEKTEPNYFKAFRVPKDVICDIHGVGHNTRSLVEKTISMAQRRRYDQVWVVMDKDSFSVDQFNQALQLAQNNNIQVAYSNEAFEIWDLLHFDFHQSALSRTTYQQRLTDRLGSKYQKNDRLMYSKLEDRLDNAVKNAQRLLASYGNDHSPAHDNPSTYVHALVIELRKYAV